MADEKNILGSKNNFWLHSPSSGYDLTHPQTLDDTESNSLRLETTTAPITIDPSKTALVVVDLQNFFLSPALGKPKDSKGLQVVDTLVEHAIPACRKAGIQIVWLNWGLTQSDIDDMPPAVVKAFSGGTKIATGDKEKQRNGNTTTEAQNTIDSIWNDAMKRDPRTHTGLGSDMGTVLTSTGKKIPAGRLLMRDQWNTALYAPLEQARQQQNTFDSTSSGPKDIIIHKNRLSGLWGASTECTEYLESTELRTLIFAGVNTDQCVLGCLQDAFTKGYDCLLLSDGSATTSPGDAQRCVEFNTAKIFGFVLGCRDLARGVDEMGRRSTE